MKARFALLFLACFAILTTLWGVAGVGRVYRQALLAVLAGASPGLNGWELTYDPGKLGEIAPEFVRGSQRLPMMLDLVSLSMAMIPFLSLLAASPGLPWRARGRAAALGISGFVLLHLGLVLLYPWLLDQPNFLKNVIGTLAGLTGFVVAPLALWFALTFRHLQPLWGLADAAEEGRPSRPERASRRKR